MKVFFLDVQLIRGFVFLKVLLLHFNCKIWRLLGFSQDLLDAPFRLLYQALRMEEIHLSRIDLKAFFLILEVFGEVPRSTMIFGTSDALKRQ